jgi:hypothetical protein
METNTDRATSTETLSAPSERRQAVTALTDRDLEIVAAAGGKKGGTPEFRA